ncbi:MULTISPECIES: hypothetical protein [Dickeya]|nr:MULTISPECIES: hypothetical protein [Dickeya]
MSEKAGRVAVLPVVRWTRLIRLHTIWLALTSGVAVNGAQV